MALKTIVKEMVSWLNTVLVRELSGVSNPAMWKDME
jgi:hypothetical protein